MYLKLGYLDVTQFDWPWAVNGSSDGVSRLPVCSCALNRMV